MIIVSDKMMKNLKTALLLSCVVALIGYIITTPKPGLGWVSPLWVVVTGAGYILSVLFEVYKNRG